MKKDKPKMDKIMLGFYERRNKDRDVYWLCQDFSRYVEEKIEKIHCSDMVDCSECMFASKFVYHIDSYIIEDKLEKLDL